MASSLSTDDRRELDDILARLTALEERLFGGETTTTENDLPPITTDAEPKQGGFQPQGSPS